jgi:hypothetical protein
LFFLTIRSSYFPQRQSENYLNLATSVDVGALLGAIGGHSVSFAVVDGLGGGDVSENGLLLWITTESSGGAVEGSSGYIWVEKGVPQPGAYGLLIKAANSSHWYCRTS